MICLRKKEYLKGDENEMRDMCESLKKYKHQLGQLYYYFRFIFMKKTMKMPNVESAEDTLKYILDKKVSVSRFGDGEFKWMFGLKQNSFQKDDELLRDRLKEVQNSTLDNHIVCIPDIFASLKHYRFSSKLWWGGFGGRYGKLWIASIDLDKTYFDTQISRFYIDYLNLNRAKKIIELWKKIWDRRDVIIIEGNKTRLGYKNDLFDNANSVHRILAPAVDAFSVYDDILETSIRFLNKECLVLIALGPTATVLAYDLSQKGFQAIDVGHLDIEYEWYLLRAKKKCPIESKFVNEATHLGGRNVEDAIADINFNQQILTKVEA